MSDEYDGSDISSAGGVTRRDFVRKSLLIGAGVAAAPLLGGILGDVASATPLAIPGAPAIPLEIIKMGIGPYVDHAYWVIGVDRGWFSEVGITLTPAPAGRSTVPEDWGPLLISKSVDIQSASETHYLGSMKTARNLRELVWSDLFEGWAILVQPDLHLVSAAKMIADGVAPNLAIKRAIEQLKGKIFLYPSDPGAKPFVSEAFAKAGMVLTDVHAEMVDDAEQIPLMLTKRADAQVSGVPVRLQLQADGFQVLVSAADLVKSATPSANSPELLTVFRDGAATTEEWYTSNEDTALRFVSVVFRITDFIHSQPTTAAKIEGPFVNYLSGTSLKTSSTLLAYNSLDPFYTFSMQKEWYDDVNSPFYYAYEIGAYIKYWEEQKLFTPGAVTVDDIALNAVVYKKMEGYRSQASALITKTERKIAGRQGAPAQLLAAAQTYYTHFNFLDAWRFAQAAASKA